MKITIIREDGAVYKDGTSYSDLDLTVIPSDVHAVQFNTVSNKGWIEFAEDDSGNKQPNEVITSLPLWASASLTKWDEAKAAEDLIIEQARLAAEAAAQAELEQQQQSTGTV